MSAGVLYDCAGLGEAFDPGSCPALMELPLVFSSERMASLYGRSRKWLDRFAGGRYVLFGAHLVANR